MAEENLVEMTEEMLLARLHEEGFTDITLRNIVERRRAGLLPPFDTPGKGRGPGLGREISTWGNGEFVLYQAICVEKLLRAHRSYQRAYIPLQMLRLSVPRKRIREALEAVVITGFTARIEDPNASDMVEDLISDEIAKATKKLKKKLKEKKLEPLASPPGFFEFIGNLFFNPDKGWLREDSIDEEAKKGIVEWQERLARKLPRLGPVDISGEMARFINNAEFWHDHFSLPALQEALAKASDEHFHAVERDLQHLGAMGQMIVELLRKNPPPGPEINLDFFYEVLFAGGTYFALFDLSLRYRGRGAQLEEAFGKISRDFVEWHTVAASSKFLMAQAYAAAKCAEAILATMLRDLGGGDTPPPNDYAA